MPTTLKTKWRRSVLRYGCAAAAWGFVALGTARAQSLDMDASPTTPSAATHQSGGLDMDVSPTAPIAAPVIPKSPIQALSSRANVQDGIVQVNPTASPGQT